MDNLDSMILDLKKSQITIDVENDINNFFSQLHEMIISICEIPAPTFHEHKRAKYLQDQFQKLGLKTIIDAHVNVIARFPGKNSSARLAICAHIDTVFPIQNIVTFSRLLELTPINEKLKNFLSKIQNRIGIENFQIPLYLGNLGIFAKKINFE